MMMMYDNKIFMKRKLQKPLSAWKMKEETNWHDMETTLYNGKSTYKEKM